MAQRMRALNKAG